MTGVRIGIEHCHDGADVNEKAIVTNFELNVVPTLRDLLGQLGIVVRRTDKLSTDDVQFVQRHPSAVERTE